MKGVFRALKYLRGYWNISIGALSSLLLVNLANLASPLILKALICSVDGGFFVFAYS